MNRTARYTFAAALFAILIAPVTTFAQYQQQGFLFPYGTGAGAPREQLVVYSFGPSSSGSQSSSYPWYNNYPQYPSYNTPTYALPMTNNVYSGMGYNSYSYPSYSSYGSGYGQSYGYFPSYSYPQYTSYSYPSYGYTDYGYYGGYGYGGGYGGYGQPSGGADLWGNPLCNWGSDYGNFPCDRDPHQWVYDPYSGTYY